MTSLQDLNPNLQNQQVFFDEKNLLLKTPFKLYISGQSGCGKSFLCQKILSEKLYDKPASRVTLCLPKNSRDIQ